MAVKKINLYCIVSNGHTKTFTVDIKKCNENNKACNYYNQVYNENV